MASRVCGIMDMDGFQMRDGIFRCRELGLIAVDPPYSVPWRYAFDLTSYFDGMDRKERRTALYATRHVHGLPFRPMPGESVMAPEQLESIVEGWYESVRTEERFVVAYKGGTFERDLLYDLGIVSTDLGQRGCPKYDDLTNEKYARWNCPFHVMMDEEEGKVPHCPSAEVVAFRDWFLDQ